MTAGLEGFSFQGATFDFWNTLVYEPQGHLRSRRLDAWVGILEEAGFACEREQLHVVFDSSWERYVASWKANQQYQALEAAEHVVEALGFEVPPDVKDALLEAFLTAGHEADLHLTDGLGECLRLVKDAGLRTGIVCDVGMTPSTVLRAHLERHGVLDLFDAWAFSDDVGVYKPDPRIFEHVLAGMGGLAPERVAHAGDLRRTDIAGAKAMGMRAVRYTGVFDDDTQPEPEADHVISSWGQLPEVLGLG
jgi:FMN phosphatase YigB (HAD superfamily)